MAFAHELASEGFNIILHGRSPTKLATVEVTLKTHVSAIGDYVRGLAKDSLCIHVLVNNIGSSALVIPVFRPLTQLMAEDVQKLFDVNIGFSTLLTRALLPVMQEPSLVLNIGSFVSHLLGPWIAVYAGSKAFIMAWGRSLGAELRAEGKDVEVMGLFVGKVQSAGHLSSLGPVTCSSQMLVRSALDKVGCGRHTVTPWWRHAVLLVLILSLPDGLLELTTVRTMRGIMEEERRVLGMDKQNL